MKIDPNAPVYPNEGEYVRDLNTGDSQTIGRFPGLTIRAHFAAMAMQGIVRRFGAQCDCSTTVALDARDAVRYADALIAELNK